MKIKQYTTILSTTLLLLVGCDHNDINTQAPIVTPTPNQPPVISMEHNLSVIIGNSVDINVTAMDYDGNITSYEWKEGNQTLSYSADWVYTPSSLGMHTLVCSVTDDKGAVSSDSMGINVLEDKSAKIIMPSNWYIKITAFDVSRGMKTSSTQLGELEEDDVVAKHTLKALKPFGGSYLDIVFRNPDGVEEGDYKVNFHRYNPDGYDSWDFVVRTNDKNADIKLSWIGLYVLQPYTDKQGRLRYREYRSTNSPIIKYMKLLDVDNDAVMPAVFNGKVQSCTINMNGLKERKFRWILSQEEVKMFKSSYKPLKPNKKVVKQKVDADFDLTKPPTIE